MPPVPPVPSRGRHRSRGPEASPPGGVPGDPRASRVTTGILIAALVVVVLITGVLSTIAVLMTRNPDMPLGGTPPRRLSIPIHFAPVTGTQAGSCTTPEGVPDDQGRTCYTIAAGVNVNAVRKIEAVQEKSGAYSVRIAFAPAFREQISDLTQEAVNQPIAIVVGEKVVAAPRVAQVITDDSLSIAGSFTKEQADAMVVRLLGGGTGGTGGVGGTGAPTGQPQPTSPTVTSVPSNQPVSPPGATPPAGTTSQPTASSPTIAPAAGPATTRSPVTTPVTTSTAGAARAGEEGLDHRYPDCKAAFKDGYGPYFKETHEEYKWYVDKDKNGVACDSGDMT
ncbi:hypothetical protein DKM19_11270 [Streptosporangium sp. 'caverna']|nr:hypothetical protein DKM19_11270 [Streptosporangium sp. 'caverna']